jgi:AcrR family transcriptional regulator
MRGRIPGAVIGSRAAKARTRRILPAEVRVDDLMAAAADLFIAKGIAATTVDDIVAKAGVGKGTFYHYFDTKADVIVALRDRFAAEFVAHAAAAVDACPPDDHPGRLSAWLAGAVEAYLSSYRLHDVVFHDFTHSQRKSREKDSVLAQLVTLLDDGQRSGIWRFTNARTVALIVFDGMHGVVDDAIAAGQRDAKPLVELLNDAFVRMLKA